MHLIDDLVRWGVIGCGQIAVDKSLPGLLDADGARLVAVSDPLPTRQEAARAVAEAKNAPSPKTYADYHDLLDDGEIDAVYIALPTGMHAHAVQGVPNV